MARKKLMDTLEWLVYYHDINAEEIITVNIFDYLKFTNYLQDLRKKYKQHPEIDLAEEIRLRLFYCFGSKCEYEVVIKEWVGRSASLKIDIYSQVMLNYNRFLEYLLPKLFKEAVYVSES